MVAGFQDDLDSDDLELNVNISSTVNHQIEDSDVEDNEPVQISNGEDTVKKKVKRTIDIFQPTSTGTSNNSASDFNSWLNGAENSSSVENEDQDNTVTVEAVAVNPLDYEDLSILEEPSSLSRSSSSRTAPHESSEEPTEKKKKHKKKDKASSVSVGPNLGAYRDFM